MTQGDGGRGRTVGERKNAEQRIQMCAILASLDCANDNRTVLDCGYLNYSRNDFDRFLAV